MPCRCLLAQGKFEAALRLRIELLARTRQLHGANSVDTGRCLADVAAAYRGQVPWHHLLSARPLLFSLHLSRPQCHLIRWFTADASCLQDKWAKARPLYQEAMEIFERAFGKADQRTKTSATELYNALFFLGGRVVTAEMEELQAEYDLHRDAGQQLHTEG